MKFFLRKLCLRRRLKQLHQIGARAMDDYMRVAEVFECTLWEAERFHPWLSKYRQLAVRCAKRARRLHRRLGIRPASSSY